MSEVCSTVDPYESRALIERYKKWEQRSSRAEQWQGRWDGVDYYFASFLVLIIAPLVAFGVAAIFQSYLLLALLLTLAFGSFGYVLWKGLRHDLSEKMRRRAGNALRGVAMPHETLNYSHWGQLTWASRELQEMPAPMASDLRPLWLALRAAADVVAEDPDSSEARRAMDARYDVLEAIFAGYQTLQELVSERNRELRAEEARRRQAELGSADLRFGRNYYRAIRSAAEALRGEVKTP